MSGWIPCSGLLPEDGRIVMTKIDDASGCRNETVLRKNGRLWFHADGSTYVYYCPTHWKPIDPAIEAEYEAALKSANESVSKASSILRGILNAN